MICWEWRILIYIWAPEVIFCFSIIFPSFFVTFSPLLNHHTSNGTANIRAKTCKYWVCWAWTMVGLDHIDVYTSGIVLAFVESW